MKYLQGTDAANIRFSECSECATNAVVYSYNSGIHGRVFIVELMGHKVGWLTLHAGILTVQF